MTTRHDSVARTVYSALCQKHGLRVPHWNARIPSVQVVDDIKLSWAPKVEASTVRHNCPDMILETATKAYIIELTVPWYGRLDAAYDLKHAKYATNSTLSDSEKTPYPAGPNLQRDLTLLLNKPTETVPLVIGTCGEVSDSLRRSLEAIGFKGSGADDLIAKMGRSAVLGTCLVLRAHMNGSEDAEGIL